MMNNYNTETGESIIWIHPFLCMVSNLILHNRELLLSTYDLEYGMRSGHPGILPFRIAVNIRCLMPGY